MCKCWFRLSFAQCDESNFCENGIVVMSRPVKIDTQKAFHGSKELIFAGLDTVRAHVFGTAKPVKMSIQSSFDGSGVPIFTGLDMMQTQMVQP